MRAAGFRPLPDVDDDGELIGTRLWRVHAGYVEYLALRPHGLAHAVRAEATFDYQHPTEHPLRVPCPTCLVLHGTHISDNLRWQMNT